MKKSGKIVLKNLVYPAIGAAIILLIWFVAAKIYGFSLILPTPLKAFKAFRKLFDQNFSIYLWRSLLRTVAALGISFFAALILAVLSKLLPPFRQILSPIMSVVRSLPTLAITTLLLLWTKSTVMPIYVACMVVLPVCYSSLFIAMQNVDLQLLEAARLYNLTKPQIVTRIYLPSISGAMVENIASGFSLSFKVVISAEILAFTASSIGIFMQTAKADYSIDLLFATVIAVCAISIAAEFLLRLPLKFLHSN